MEYRDEGMRFAREAGGTSWTYRILIPVHEPKANWKAEIEAWEAGAARPEKQEVMLTPDEAASHGTGSSAVRAFRTESGAQWIMEVEGNALVLKEMKEGRRIWMAKLTG